MEIRSTITCCGCLNNGRRMVEISEINLRKCFSEIINENLISNFSSQLLQLCFECTAMLLKFTNFRLQVSACYKTFQTYAKQNSSFNRKPIMRLCTKQLHNIQINTSVTSQSSEATEVIGNVKVENDTDDVLVDVLETDVIKDEFSNQDVLLIKNSSFNRRPITGHRSIRLPSLHVDELNTSQSSEVTEVIADKVKVETETDDVLDVDNVKEEFSDHDDEVPLIKIKKKKKRPNGKLEMDRELEFTEVTLSAKEIEHERATLALRDDYVNAMFRCDKCLLTFPNEDDLNDHVRVKHEQYASHYKCAICTCSFSSEVSYNYHTNKHTRRYQCTVCADKFTSKRAAIKHYNFIHCYGAAIEYEFDQNNLDNTDQTAVKDAEEKDVSTAEENTFPCDFCEKNFKWKTSLRKHLEKHRIENGQKRKPYCAPCRLSFTTTPNLQKHVRTSSKHQIQLKLRKLNENSESNDKETPQKQSKQKTQLMDEIKSSVNKSQPKYLCHQCDKVFLWRGNLLRHLQSHAAKAKGDLVCKPCNRTFSSIATYQQHMKISKKHVSENDFKYMCSECGKRFATKSQLRDHINWEHLKNFVYTCDECQKVFKTSNSVYLHKQAVHKTDSVEHLCDHCGKPFPSKAKLRNHILGTHSGGALYRCACCDARFSWQSCLSRHVRHKHRKMTDKVS